jgi:probable rRNA maturation factor
VTPADKKKTVLTFLNLQNRLRLGAAFRASAGRAVSVLLKAEGYAKGGSINVCVMDDSRIRRINELYLGHDRPTDVISFNLSQGGTEALEAEIAVSAQAAARNAAQYGNTAQKELLVYIIHGVLHALGYDDRTAVQRAKMQEKTDAAIDRICGKTAKPQRR